jgi:hypothetical protein
MPVELLSDEQVAAYDRVSGAPRRVELERVLFLDDADLALVTKHRGDHSLGFALQLATVRAVGTFLVPSWTTR